MNVYLGSRDGTIKLWSTTHIPDPLNTLPKRKSLLSRRKHSGKVRYVPFSPSKQILSSISYDCSLLLWDVESMDTVLIIPFPFPFVFFLSSPSAGPTTLTANRLCLPRPSMMT